MPECEFIKQDFIMDPNTNNKILTIGSPPWGTRELGFRICKSFF